MNDSDPIGPQERRGFSRDLPQDFTSHLLVRLVLHALDGAALVAIPDRSEEQQHGPVTGVAYPA